MALSMRVKKRLFADLHCLGRRTAGNDGSISVCNDHQKHQPRGQQTMPIEFRQGAAGPHLLDRILDRLERLVDCPQIAHHLCFVGVCELLERLGHHALSIVSFGLDDLSGGDPDRHQQRQRKQRQREVGFLPDALPRCLHSRLRLAITHGTSCLQGGATTNPAH